MTKCAALWKHTNIRNNNRVYPCCRYKTPIQFFDGDVDNILNSPQYVKLRETFSIDDPNCAKCKHEESLGKVSLREKFNAEYDTDTVELKHLELGLDNICNLTCDGCFGEFSSEWSKIENPDKPNSFHIRSTKDFKNVPQSVNKILFLGGEPLMTKRHLKVLSLVENKQDTTVIYNTNGTFLLDIEVLNMLEKFKSIEIILSLDGYAEVNDKVRGGSNWKDILKFIDQITGLGYKLSINSVLHLNNWQGFTDLEKFVNSLSVEWTVNVLTYPKRLDIANTKEPSNVINLVKNLNIENKDYIIEHVRKGVLVDPKTYSDFKRLPQLIEVIKDEILNYKWMDKIPQFDKTEMVTSTDQPSWMIIKHSLTKGMTAYYDNVEEGWEKNADDSKDWLTLYLHEAGKNIVYNKHINPYFKKTYEKIKELNLDGLVHVSVHFMEPGGGIPQHTDMYDSSINSILYSFSVDEGYELYIDDQLYKLPENDFFGFNPEIEHRALNKNKKWLGVMLRINKDKFK